MILYFLKTSLLLGLFYMLYLFFLKDTKSFKWNRIFLLTSSAFAFLIPFLQHITLIKKTVIDTPIIYTLQTINIYATTIQTKELDYAKIILAIYAAGLLWGILRIILGFIVIQRIKLSSRLEKIGNDLIYFNPAIESPFSFYTNIYIPDSFRHTDVLKIIIKHEQAHIELKHSRDKFYFSLLQAFFWINPFVYLYHKEMELLHEFEADELSTQEFATDDYVENLLQTIQYTQTPTLLAHHFFHHPLKTRITMLYSKTKQTFMQKATVILTGILLCLFFMAIQSIAQKKKYELKQQQPVVEYDTAYIEKANGDLEMRIIKREPKQNKIMIDIEESYNTVNGEKVYNFVEIMPEYPGGEDAMLVYLSKSIRYPAVDKKNKNEGRIMLNFTIDENGSINDIVTKTKSQNVSSAMEAEAIRVIKSMPKWTPGKSQGKAVKVSYLLPIMFRL
jgi:TonB family protein